MTTTVVMTLRSDGDYVRRESFLTDLIALWEHCHFEYQCHYPCHHQCHYCCFSIAAVATPTAAPNTTTLITGTVGARSTQAPHEHQHRHCQCHYGYYPL